ncbi:DUF2199 domain-containing protein [Pseudomonas sp. efr-133-TYG-103a]|uniref:DUF2199 domain-containing protein n=1 Tax=Pseudomonas sp. efr-133-TYG-103a TaxID=3040308 RepID=UPI00359C1505
MSSFLCSTCNKQHDDLPMCFGPGAPDHWFSMPESERAERGELSSDQCVIDDKHFLSNTALIVQRPTKLIGCRRILLLLGASGLPR